MWPFPENEAAVLCTPALTIHQCLGQAKKICFLSHISFISFGLGAGEIGKTQILIASKYLHTQEKPNSIEAFQAK